MEKTTKIFKYKTTVVHFKGLDINSNYLCIILVPCSFKNYDK